MKWHLTSEEFIWTLVVMIGYWLHVVKPNSMFDHKGPEVGCNNLSPKVYGLE